ncbi:MAG: hypothetical protein ACJAZ2_002206 [Glaciecola sp.]|jgi:hypothetical protein
MIFDQGLNREDIAVQIQLRRMYSLTFWGIL